MIKVIAAQMHSTIWVPGPGELKKTLDSKNYKNMEMQYSSEGVYIHYKGFKFLLPVSNFQSIVFDPEAQYFVDFSK